MTPLLAAALGIQEFCDQREWKSCIIGGIAVLRWGEARFTRDVDLTLLTGYGHELKFIESILNAGYRGRLSDAADFALKNRVLLLESPQDVPIDISLAAFPFESIAIARATPFEFEPGCKLRTCSAEDLIVQKLFAFRPRDIFDVQTIADKQAGALDWNYIETQLAPLAELKEQAEIMASFVALRNADRPR